MKLKGIVLAVIVSLASIMMPFSVYAETIDSHIRGRNYTYEPITYNEIQVSTNTYYENIGVIHITFELDDEYIGYVLPNYTLQYDNYFYGASTPNWGTLSKTFDRRIFVNGSSFSFDVTVNWNSININNAPGGDPFNYDSYTITSSDVTKYADIDSLDQIINILQDLYTSNDQVEGLLNDQLTQLQNIVANTSLANQYLETISKLRQYNIFPESYLYVTYMMRSYNILEYGVNNITILNYPVFQVPSGSNIGKVYLTSTSNKYLVIMWINKNIYNQQSLESNISINGNATLEWVGQVYSGYHYYDGALSKIIKFYINRNDTSEVVNLVTNSNSQIIPFYLNDVNLNNFTTDFALYFGLKNDLLNDIHIIANGTSQSNSAASDLESGNDQMADDMDDLATIENGYNQQFNNQLQQIDFSNPLQSNSGILPAANFVITIFNGLINNNPFSVLIIIVCILLIGKKVIGK